MTDEIAIAACEAINAEYRKTSKGIRVSFLINPEDVHDELALLPLGEIVKLYVTKHNIGP